MSIRRLLVLIAPAVLLAAAPSSAALFGADANPKCTLAAGDQQLSIAGSVLRTCGPMTQGSLASVTDSASALDCNAIPSAIGGGDATLFIQWDDSVGAAGEWKCVTGSADVALADAITANAHSGVLTGGEITANADPTKFDLAAGTGIVSDWTDPANPVYIPVSWAEQLAVTPSGLTTEVFTTLAIDSTGTLIQRAGVQLTPQERRTCIELQAVVHANLTSIDTITGNSIPAYEVTKAIIDYIETLGPINSGNAYGANGVNLQVDKIAGLTTLPFINRNTDPQDPTNRTDPSQTAISTLVFNWQDGSGGVNTLPAQSFVDPDFYDDGSGTLASVGNNRWQIQRLYFFSQAQATLIAYGQETYGSASAARAAIFTEDFTPNPIIRGRGTLTTVLLLKKGATDLSDVGVAEFVVVSVSSTSSGSFAPNNSTCVDHINCDDDVDSAVTTLPDGLVATPAISFASDIDTGLFMSGGRIHYTDEGVDLGELATLGGSIGQVGYFGPAGTLIGSPNMTFDGTTLTAADFDRIPDDGNNGLYMDDNPTAAGGYDCVGNAPLTGDGIWNMDSDDESGVPFLCLPDGVNYEIPKFTAATVLSCPGCDWTIDNTGVIELKNIRFFNAAKNAALDVEFAKITLSITGNDATDWSSIMKVNVGTSNGSIFQQAERFRIDADGGVEIMSGTSVGGGAATLKIWDEDNTTGSITLAVPAVTIQEFTNTLASNDGTLLTDESPATVTVMGTTASPDLDDMVRGRFIANAGSTGVVTLPAVDVGTETCFYDRTGNGIELDPLAVNNDLFILPNGTVLAIGNSMVSTTANAIGDFVCIFSIDGNEWGVLASSGTWTDKGS